MVPEEANSPTFAHIETEMFEAEKYYHPWLNTRKEASKVLL